MFGRPTADAQPGRLEYRYGDDYKRPSPPVATMAQAHPSLTLLLEYSDEFGQQARRIRYENGVEVCNERVDPRSFGWMEWIEGDE